MHRFSVQRCSRIALVGALCLLPAHGAKPSPPPPPPPPPAQPVLYVDAGLKADATHAAQPLDNTPSWWTKAPGTTPSSDIGWTVFDATLDRAQQIALEAGCNLKIVAYHGEALVYGQSFELALGGNMAWAAPEYPSGSTSGLHFQSSFFSNVGNSNHKSFSDAQLIFGLTNSEMMARSIILEGMWGPGGGVDDQSQPGYGGNFTQGGFWTDSQKLLMQSAYGIAQIVPEPSGISYAGAGLIALLIFTPRRWCR